jgi:uncharacterized phage protein (TIGR01671 family)
MEYQENMKYLILPWKDTPELWDSIEIMQFTWLLDKNGKEIYEGDILKWKSDETFCGVEFDEQINKVEYQNNSYVLIDIEDWEIDNEEWYEELDNMEIIWNIYENKNLL